MHRCQTCRNWDPGSLPSALAAFGRSGSRTSLYGRCLAIDQTIVGRPAFIEPDSAPAGTLITHWAFGCVLHSDHGDPLAVVSI